MSTEQLERRLAALEQVVADLQQQLAELSVNRDTEEPAIELTEKLKAEIDRRLADAEANPQDSIPWEQVKAAALARFPKK
jgi:putative addiction module component (TIGR02574 family)